MSLVCRALRPRSGSSGGGGFGLGGGDVLRRLFCPLSGELTLKTWRFSPPVTVYCSPNNPGALEAVRKIKAGVSQPLAAVEGAESSRGIRWLASALRATTNSFRRLELPVVPSGGGNPSGEHEIGMSITTTPASGEIRFALYLSDETWVGDTGAALARR